eukprot:9869806-Lingulodinium_polyedra.AAC.1
MVSSPSPNAGCNALPQRRRECCDLLAPKQSRDTSISVAASPQRVSCECIPRTMRSFSRAALRFTSSPPS